MIKNYFKSAYRNIVRNKFYSLAIGFIATIIILLYNQNELNYDKHNEKYDRIYRLESHFTIAGKDDLFAVTSVPLGPAFKIEYPEVEQFVRLLGGDGMLGHKVFQIFNEDHETHASFLSLQNYTSAFPVLELPTQILSIPLNVLVIMFEVL